MMTSSYWQEGVLTKRHEQATLTTSMGFHATAQLGKRMEHPYHIVQLFARRNHFEYCCSIYYRS